MGELNFRIQGLNWKFSEVLRPSLLNFEGLGGLKAEGVKILKEFDGLGHHEAVWKTNGLSEGSETVLQGRDL